MGSNKKINFSRMDIHKTVETVKEMDNILDIDSLLDKNNQKLRKIKG